MNPQPNFNMPGRFSSGDRWCPFCVVQQREWIVVKTWTSQFLLESITQHPMCPSSAVCKHVTSDSTAGRFTAVGEKVFYPTKSEYLPHLYSSIRLKKNSRQFTLTSIYKHQHSIALISPTAIWYHMPASKMAMGGNYCGVVLKDCKVKFQYDHNECILFHKESNIEMNFVLLDGLCVTPSNMGITLA